MADLKSKLTLDTSQATKALDDVKTKSGQVVKSLDWALPPIKPKVDTTQIKQADEEVGKLGKSFKTMLEFAGGQALFNIGKSLLTGLTSGASELAGVQLMAEKKVAQVIKSTGGAAGVSLQATKDLSSELQSMTNFGDEAILTGEHMLLTFTNIGSDVFPQATETILNMATATGTDLKSSAVQLGKALNDPIKGISALTEVGVTFTNEQKKQIKAMQEAGDMAGAQKVILAELGKEFGGLAAAAADPFTQIENSFSDVKEGFGFIIRDLVGLFLPAIKAGIGILNDIFGFLRENSTITIVAIGLVTSALGLMTLGLIIQNAQLIKNTIISKAKFVADVAVTGATAAWTAAQWLLNAAFSASPLGWIILAVGALVAIVAVCYNKFEGFRKIVDAVWEAIKSAAMWMGDLLGITTEETEASKESAAAKEKQIAANLALADSIQKIADSVQEEKDRYVLAKKTLEEVTKTYGENSREYKKALKEYNDANVWQQERDTENAEKSKKNAKKQTESLDDLVKKLVKLKIAGEDGSDTYKALFDRVVKLTEKENLLAEAQKSVNTQLEIATKSIDGVFNKGIEDVINFTSVIGSSINTFKLLGIQSIETEAGLTEFYNVLKLGAQDFKSTSGITELKDELEGLESVYYELSLAEEQYTDKGKELLAQIVEKRKEVDEYGKTRIQTAQENADAEIDIEKKKLEEILSYKNAFFDATQEMFDIFASGEEASFAKGLKNFGLFLVDMVKKYVLEKQLMLALDAALAAATWNVPKIITIGLGIAAVQAIASGANALLRQEGGPVPTEGGMTSPGMKYFSINEDGRPEYIVNAKSTAKYRDIIEMINADKDPAMMILNKVFGLMPKQQSGNSSNEVVNELKNLGMKVERVERAQMNSHSRSSVQVEMSPLKASGGDFYAEMKSQKRRAIKGY